MIVNAQAFLDVYKDVANGKMVRPRGQLVYEVTDYMFKLNMMDSPLTSFKARNLNLKYAKQEWLWYLRADKFDTSIEEHATLWKKIKQPDGSYFSNYGQYLFPDQFAFVVSELIKDPDSRRACMVLLQPHHLFLQNSDVVCTYGINFRIRNNRLDMSVMMRSGDVIWGLTNDVFCFSMLYRLMLVALMDEMTDLKVGTYTHFVNSLHVYERHFEMIRNLISDGMGGYTHIQVPWPANTGPLTGELGRWLQT